MFDASLDVIAGLAAGIVLGAAFAWRRSRPLDNDWTRGVIAVLGAVGALLIAFFFSIPAYLVAGLPGLAGLGGAAAALAVAGSRWAVRGAGRGTGDEGRGA